MDEIESRIDDTVLKSKDVVMKHLKVANSLIADIKTAMSKGVDMISVVQLEEWAVAIPIINEELVPYREVFALTKNLWDIEMKQLSAKNMLELNEKKTKIDSINKLAGTEGSKKRAISEFVQNSLAGTQESLWMLGNAIRKILDARIASGDCK